MSTLAKLGPTVSIALLNTLFCVPGVPPIVAFEAIHFCALEQGVTGLINSNV